jgi:hypothetical protein
MNASCFTSLASLTEAVYASIAEAVYASIAEARKV